MLDRGIDVCEDLGLEGWRLYVLAYRARLHLDRGRWDEAAADAAFVLRSARSVPLLRILALTVLGLVRARRGDPDAWPLLDEALALARTGRTNCSTSRRWRAARAEAAWLEAAASASTRHRRRRSRWRVDRRAAWVIGELAWLRRLAGIAETVAGAVEPYAVAARRRRPRGRRRWTELGCPYDAALALLDSDDEDGLRRALAEFQRLGARPAAAIVARRLREHGVRGLPRGPRPATRSNPARLTRARDRGAGAGRSRGCRNARDRRPAVPVGEDRAPPRVGDPAQARRRQPRAGRLRGGPARAHLRRNLGIRRANLGSSPGSRRPRRS